MRSWSSPPYKTPLQNSKPVSSSEHFVGPETWRRELKLPYPTSTSLHRSLPLCGVKSSGGELKSSLCRNFL